MILLIFIAGLLTLAVGLLAKWYLDGHLHGVEHDLYAIDNRELAVTTCIMCFLVLPLTGWVGKEVAVSNQVSFYESWNGWETAAQKLVTTCYEDGSCAHHYDCDPYECGEWVTDYDDKGKPVGKHYESRTCYHSCPYCTEEWTFVVKSTVGDFTIAANNLPTDPDSHRWRWSHSVPSYLPSGVPDFWWAVKQRLDAGNPGPVTVRKSYDNFILASQKTNLHKFSGDIDGYLKAGLLPALVREANLYARPADVRNSGDQYAAYMLNRVYQVGVKVPGDWDEAINRFNAEFGTQLQGDLHIVIVDANKVLNPDNYMGALLAYWEGSTFKKEALSKNAVVIVLGTRDGKTVDWARAGTGMPLGNEALVVQLQFDLKGANLDPATLLGYPKARVVSESKVDIQPAGSLLEKILWGPHKFARVHMKGNDGQSGFLYLQNEIEPTTGQKIGILFVMFLLSCGAWGITIRFGHEIGQRLGLGSLYRR